MATEVGRQPFVVYGWLRTRDAISPVADGAVATSLVGVLVVYSLVFSAGALYIGRLLFAGPSSSDQARDAVAAPGNPLQLAAAAEEIAP